MPLITTLTSPAFSGYISADPVDPALATIDSVSASWVVPTIAASGTFALMAVWVGIGGTGGASPSYVIQVGTVHVVSGLTPNTVRHFAYMEFVGDTSIPGFGDLAEQAIRGLPIDIAAGQTVSAVFTREATTPTGLGIFRVDFTNVTTGVHGAWHFATPLGFPDPQIEWIGAESPSFGFGGSATHEQVPQFGTVDMSACRVTISGANQTLNAIDNVRLNLINSAALVQVATSLVGGDNMSFTSTRQAVASP